MSDVGWPHVARSASAESGYLGLLPHTEDHPAVVRHAGSASHVNDAVYFGPRAGDLDNDGYADLSSLAVLLSGYGTTCE